MVGTASIQEILLLAFSAIGAVVTLAALIDAMQDQAAARQANGARMLIASARVRGESIRLIIQVVLTLGAIRAVDSPAMPSGVPVTFPWAAWFTGLLMSVVVSGLLLVSSALAWRAKLRVRRMYAKEAP